MNPIHSLITTATLLFVSTYLHTQLTVLMHCAVNDFTQVSK